MANIIGNGSILSCTVDSDEKLPVLLKNNSTTETSTNVVITFTFPPGLQAATVQPAPTDGTFDGTDKWTVPSLGPLDQESFDINVEVTDSTLKPWELDYVVTSDQHPDDIPANDDGKRHFDADFSCDDFDQCNLLNERHGNVLYVSIQGDNSTAVKGDGHRPWRDPWAASAAAASGDTVYVYAGEYAIGDVGNTLFLNGVLSPVDVVWDGSQHLMFSSLSPAGFVHWHFDENATIFSTVDSSSFFLYEIGFPRPEGFELTITGKGAWFIKAGTAIESISAAVGLIDIELQEYSTGLDRLTSPLGLEERDNLFIYSMFSGHTNIKIASVRTRGPNFLRMERLTPGSINSCAITVDIGTWLIDAPTSLASEATAGTDDSMVKMTTFGVVGFPLLVEFNIGTLTSIWKAKGLLCNLHMNESIDLRDVSVVYNIGSWYHIDALIDDGTPYVIDENLTPYRSGSITDTSNAGAMVYLAADNALAAELDNMSVVVNVGASNFDGMLFDNYNNEVGIATTRNNMIFTSKEHKQAGTPFTVRNGSNSNTAGVSKVVIDVLSAFVDAVPFHLENPLAADSGPKRYISGNFECVGSQFIQFNDQICNRALTIKDALIITDQTNSFAPITGGDTNQVLFLSSASNKATEAGLTEVGQPLTVDSNYE